MQDLSVNDLADEIRDELLQQGISISRTSVRRMTRHFFRYVEMIAEKKDVRLNFQTRDISYVYPIFDVKNLCDELAAGEGDIITVDYLYRKKKLSRRVFNYVRKHHKIDQAV